MLKILLKAQKPSFRVQQYINQELPDVQAGFRKGRGIGDQMANKHMQNGQYHWLSKKHKTTADYLYTSVPMAKI